MSGDVLDPRVRGWVAAPFGWDAPGVAGVRLQQRLGALRRHDGGAFVGPGPAPLIPGVRHFPVEVPPGLDLERAEQLVAEVLGELLITRHPAPRFVHAFGLGLAARAMPHQRRGLRVYVEPGVTTAQRVRAERPEISAERVEPLVRLEDQVLAAADGVVARGPVEAATLVRRGTLPERLLLLRDGVLNVPAMGPPPADLPHLAMLATGEPWDGWQLGLAAFARVTRTWRLTLFVRAPLARSTVEAVLAGLKLHNRVDLAPADPIDFARIAASQAFVVSPAQTRPVLAGAADQDAALLALSAGRPVVGPDLPSLRAVAGAALLPCESAEDASGLARAIERLLADGALRAHLTESAEARRAVLSWHDADDLLGTLWSLEGEAD